MEHQSSESRDEPDDAVTSGTSTAAATSRVLSVQDEPFGFIAAGSYGFIPLRLLVWASNFGRGPFLSKLGWQVSHPYWAFDFASLWVCLLRSSYFDLIFSIKKLWKLDTTILSIDLEEHDVKQKSNA